MTTGGMLIGECNFSADGKKITQKLAKCILNYAVATSAKSGRNTPLSLVNLRRPEEYANVRL